MDNMLRSMAEQVSYRSFIKFRTTDMHQGQARRFFYVPVLSMRMTLWDFAFTQVPSQVIIPLSK